MQINRLPILLFVICAAALAALAQTPVLINDPTVEAPKVELSPDEKAIMDKSVLPKVRLKLKSDICEESVDVAGRISGSFTKPGAKQTLIFYMFCQTGNGLGSAGVFIIENGRLAGSYAAADAGVPDHANALPDVKQNGLDEFVLFYSGGMHQGGGGTGADIMEFSNGIPKGIGWFQSEEFTETSPVMGYRVSVTPGKTPVYTRVKYVQNTQSKWRKTGAPVALKLKPVDTKFEAVN